MQFFRPKRFVVLILIYILNSIAFADTKDSTVELVIEHLRSETGTIKCYLFSSENGFPRKHQLAIQNRVIPIEKNVQTVIRFDSLDSGTYAVSVFHDENNNGKLDKYPIGMPKEGMGASNNPKTRFGPPDFEQAKFHLKAGEKKRQKIKMVYLF